jgi:hypothetical protein
MITCPATAQIEPFGVAVTDKHGEAGPAPILQ